MKVDHLVNIDFIQIEVDWCFARGVEVNSVCLPAPEGSHVWNIIVTSVFFAIIGDGTANLFFQLDRLRHVA